MQLTPEKKAEIDRKSYADLLSAWRFAPTGSPLFQGEVGEYWGRRMQELKNQDPYGAVLASKQLGW